MGGDTPNLSGISPTGSTRNFVCFIIIILWTFHKLKYGWTIRLVKLTMTK